MFISESGVTGILAIIIGFGKSLPDGERAILSGRSSGETGGDSNQLFTARMAFIKMFIDNSSYDPVPGKRATFDAPPGCDSPGGRVRNGGGGERRGIGLPHCGQARPFRPSF